MAWNPTEVQAWAAVAQASFALLLLIAVGIEAWILVRHKDALDRTAEAQLEAVALQRDASERAAQIGEAQLVHLQATSPQIAVLHPTFNRRDGSISLELTITHNADVLASLTLQTAVWFIEEYGADWEEHYDFVGKPFYLRDTAGRVLKAGDITRIHLSASELPGLEQFVEAYHDALGEWEQSRSSSMDRDFSMYVVAKTQLGAENHAAVHGM